MDRVDTMNVFLNTSLTKRHLQTNTLMLDRNVPSTVVLKATVVVADVVSKAFLECITATQDVTKREVILSGFLQVVLGLLIFEREVLFNFLVFMLRCEVTLRVALDLVVDRRHVI